MTKSQGGSRLGKGGRGHKWEMLSGSEPMVASVLAEAMASVSQAAEPWEQENPFPHRLGAGTGLAGCTSWEEPLCIFSKKCKEP